jgi:pyruvate formate lyase activating enzyme
MRLTQLAEHVADQFRCNVCQWHCTLAPGQVGRCLVRSATEVGIVAENDGLISAAQFGVIEDYRLWHLLPGTPVMGVGSWGCAFPADQQHSQYARLPGDETKRRQLPPERVPLVALERLCRGVVWAYNDPSVSQEYLLDVLSLSRANSRYTAMITTGYHTTEALDQIGNYLDAISLDLRAFDDSAYARLAGIEHWRGILEVAAHAQHRWHCHIEVTTRMHPGVNDTPQQIEALTGWIRQTLGAQTAWHVLPGDAGSAAAAAVNRARRIGHEQGLQFIYGPDPYQSTHCTSCGTVVIERTATGTRVMGLEGSHCTSCGVDLHIRTSIFKQ